MYGGAASSLWENPRECVRPSHTRPGQEASIWGCSLLFIDFAQPPGQCTAQFQPVAVESDMEPGPQIISLVDRVGQKCCWGMRISVIIFLKLEADNFKDSLVLKR